MIRQNLGVWEKGNSRKKEIMKKKNGKKYITGIKREKG